VQRSAPFRRRRLRRFHGLQQRWLTLRRSLLDLGDSPDPRDYRI
jgi:hypothetical protein